VVSADYAITNLTDQASRFKGASQLNNAYLITRTPSSGQLNFQWYPGLSPEAMNVARVTEQPVTQGVLITLATLLRSTSFTGPLQVVNGVEDFIFCASDCLRPIPGFSPPGGSTTPNNQLGGVQLALYPNVTQFSAFAANDTGHGNVEHFSALVQYQAMLEFLT
jgi:hypothetical protein